LRSALATLTSVALVLPAFPAAARTADPASRGALAAAPSTPTAPSAPASPVAPATGPAAPAATAPSPALPLAEALHGVARADYAAARILYDDGDYAGAYTKLESAYTASKDARLLWNMAACEKAQRHYANVIALLERYLKEGSALIGDEERKATHDLVATVREFVNELRLSVQPDGTDILVDGVKAGSAPLAGSLWVDMGRRQLSFQKPGFVTNEREVDLPGGKQLDLQVSLEPERHEGTLRIVSDPSAVIAVDGHVVGTGTWVGQLPSGSHSVQLSEKGKHSHQTELVIKDNDTSSLQVNLVSEAPGAALRESRGTALWWVLGGVAVAGASVGAYFLLRPNDQTRQPELGSWGGFEL
jgi:hypothetical protein